MQIERNLEKLNIYPKEKVQLEEKIYISRTVSEMISENIEELSELYNNINMRLLSSDMYYADIDEKFGKIIYYYKNNAIYLAKDIENIPKEQLVHECVHYLQNFTMVTQTRKRAGLTNFEEFRICGLGINEATTSYITAIAMQKKSERIENEYISIVTNSNTYYKYMTSLINQIVFLIGKREAILSAINSDDEFEENLYNTFEENTDKILKNFDIILDESNSENKDEERKIEIYLQTQEIIYKTYFLKVYKLLDKKEDVDRIVQKMVDYEEIFGRTIDNSPYNERFENFLREMDDKFYKKYLEIDRKIIRNLPAVRNNNFIEKIINKIRNYFISKKKNVNY